MRKRLLDRVDSSIFEPFIIYPLFIEILSLIIYCHREVLKNETYQEDKYNEDILRNDLKRYLELNHKRLSYGVSFRTETATINSETKETKGRIDISVIYQLGISSDYDITFECKRLFKNKKNYEYINNGLMDFVNGKYAEKMPLGGMVGFVEKGNISTICTDLRKKIHKKSLTKLTGEFTSTKIQDDFEHSYKSEHKRNNKIGNITIYHLLFDYTGIIKSTQESLKFN